MRIACIIMAHKEPQQIERLLKKFAGLPFDFYIHLDKKIRREPFEYLTNLPQVNFIKKRIRVRWASYNFFYAEIQSFKEILENGKPYDFICIMSGQDYPIKPVSEIIHFLEKSAGRNFIFFERPSSGQKIPTALYSLWRTQGHVYDTHKGLRRSYC